MRIFLTIVSALSLALVPFSMPIENALAAWAAPNPVVTAAQLTAAGFTGVVSLPPTGGKYSAPVFYFKVKDSLAVPGSWGDNSNIVAVLVMPKISADWQYNNGQMEVRDYAGRTQVRVTSGQNYIVVTGPNQQKVAILAHDLQISF